MVIVLVSVATATSPHNALIDQSGAIIAGQLAQSSTEYILEKDSLALQALLTELTQKPLIAYASIEDASHQILVESGTQQIQGSRAVTSTIQLHDGIVGYASVLVAEITSPAMSAALVLLLGVMVLVLVYVLVRFRLRRLDQALQILAQRLCLTATASNSSPGAKTIGDIHRLSKALKQLAPKTTLEAGNKRAVLALRLPALAADQLAPVHLAPVAEAIAKSADRQQAAISERADGWLLIFSCGDDTAARALASARALPEMLPEGIEYAMAISIEADTATEQEAPLQGFHWQRLCDAAYQVAQGENSPLMLTRLALSNNDINQRVTVQQDDAESYRVTGFHDDDDSEHSLDSEGPVTCPVEHESPPVVV